MTSLREPAVVDEQYPVRRRRRGGGGWAALFAILLVLAGVAIVGDRVAATAASNELRSQLASDLQQRRVGYQSLDVAIGGFPFLTQVAEGRFEEITIDMTDVQLEAAEVGGASGAVVTLPTLNIVATGVVTDSAGLIRGTPTQVTASQVRGSAVVSYQTLNTLVDYSQYRLQNVQFTSTDGALRAEGTANVIGIEVPLTAVADVTVVDGQFQVNLREITAVGIEAPGVVRNYLDDLAQRTVTARLPDLPFSLTLNDVSAAPNGLAITATGHDVALVA
jgi:hypothetical protein